MQGMQKALPGSFSVTEAVQQLHGLSAEVERHAQVGSRQGRALVSITLCIVVHEMKIQSLRPIMPTPVWNFGGSVFW
jgi:hypothetical protein